MMRHCLLYRKRLLLFLSLLAVQASAQVVRQPYLQVITPNSIVVRWDSDSSRVGTVYYGSSATSLTSATSDTAATKKHELTITGLTPKQKYYYSVTGPSGGSPDQYFFTAPLPGTAQSTRIWVVSDFGQSNSASDNIRRLKTIDVWKGFNNNDTHADFMLSLGDQSESDTEAQLQDNYFNELQGVLKNTPLFTIAGNHEDTDGQVSYKATFSVPAHAEAGGYPSGTKDYYSFNYGNVHVVALTVENSVSISGAQKTWLQNDLANNKSDWLIAIMHRPMHSAGYHPTDGSSTALAQKANWLPLLEAAGVDLILAGHNHCYERSYMLDNLTGNSTDLTSANKIDTSLGRIDGTGAYHKEPGQPHQGTIFITCEGAGTSNSASHLLFPYPFFPIIYKQDIDEGSLVVDIDGSNRMDVTFLCDETGLVFSNIWDHFTIIKEPKVNYAGGEQRLVPNRFTISNFPNPFNPTTKIQFTIVNRQMTIVKVFDLLGREVATLVNEVKEKGVHTIQWSGKDEHGNDLSSGVYVAQLQVGGSVKNTKMMLLR